MKCRTLQFLASCQLQKFHTPCQRDGTKEVPWGSFGKMWWDLKTGEFEDQNTPALQIQTPQKEGPISILAFERHKLFGSVAWYSECFSYLM